MPKLSSKTASKPFSRIQKAKKNKAAKRLKLSTPSKIAALSKTARTSDGAKQSKIPTAEKAAERRVESKKTNRSIALKTAKKSMANKKAKTTIAAMPAKNDMPGKKAKKPIAAKPVKKGMADKKVKKPIAAKPVKKSVTDQKVNKPIAAKPVKKSMTDQKVKKPIAAKPVKKSMTDQKVKKPIAAKLVKKGMTDKKVKKLIAAKPVKKGMADKKVNKPMAAKITKKNAANKKAQTPIVAKKSIKAVKRSIAASKSKTTQSPILSNIPAARNVDSPESPAASLKNPEVTHKTPHYWKNLLLDFSISSKLWLEGFEIPPVALGAPARQHGYAAKEITLSLHPKHNDTTYLLLQAAWAILLNRYTGSDDIIYGTASIEHSHQPQKIIALHEPLPVRSTLHDNESIETFVKNLEKQLNKHAEKASEFYQDTESKEQFNSQASYLFLSVNKNNHLQTQATCTEIKPETYPLVLAVNEKTPSTIVFYYNHAKFTQQSIINITSHYALILQNILSEPQQDVVHFSILTQDEKRILNQWSKPTFHYPTLNQNTCCHELFIKRAAENPADLAVADSTHTLSYKELDNRSNQLAHFLLEKQVNVGESIAVLMERTPALLVAMLAIFKIGARYIPISPKYPDDRISYVLSDCNPRMILANNTKRIPAEHLEKYQLLDDTYEVLGPYSTENASRPFSPEEIAYIIYTSGTTGQPKGVMIKHISLTNLSLWYHTCFSISSNDRASQFASSGFDTFFCETVPYLTVGSSIHIIEDNAKLTPSILLPWLAEKKITICDLPTSYAQILFNMPWPSPLNLRIMKVGGESLTQYPSQSFPFDIWNIYGPTEATVECTFMKIYEANAPVQYYENKHLPPPIGRPIVNSEMYVVDQHLEPVALGNVGELLIGGTIISAGYLNRKPLTQEKFIPNLYSTDPQAKLYRSGDLVRWLSDGTLEFVGRVDNQVKIRGYRIELSEIETTIRQYPDVAEVVVLAKEIVNGQKTLIAYLVPNIDKIRIPYHEKCLINLNDVHFIEVVSDDISKEGIAVTGLTEKIQPSDSLHINIKLPGTSDGQWLSGKLMWQVDQRAGIAFDKTPKQTAAMNKCIEYYLATHNLMETIQNAASKRNIRKAIKMKLPEYMVPSIFCLLPQFPLTFNGKIDWKALPPPKDFERLLERQFVAPRTDTEKAILDIWCDILNIKQASMTDSFFDLGGNSLLVSKLSVQLMKKFNLSIPVRVLIDLPFIPILAEYIESKGQSYSSKSTIQDQIHRDAILNDDIFPTKKMGDLKHPGGILLTGVSGFLGIYLLRELLQKTEAKIYCLIRKGEFESTAKRLMTTIEQYQLSNEILLSNRRIIILEGDIGNSGFGIPTQQYNTLAEKIDTIYHCGAQVNTMASYDALRGSNVQGTIEVIKFATKLIDKAIHYISTLSAAIKLDANGSYAEEFPDSAENHLVGGYAISKWVSERLLTQIKNRGLPVSIYRLGHIWGEATTGITSVNNSLLYLIKGCIQLKLAPDWKENITFLPVDFASQAVIGISLYQPEHSSVYHLDHPRGIMWTDLVAWLQNYGYAITLCSHQQWRQQLASITPENALFPFLPQYLAEENPTVTPSTNVEGASAVLQKMGVDFPAMNDQQLRVYFNYLCQIDFLPAPATQKEWLTPTKINP